MEVERLKQVHENTAGQPRELFVKQMLYFRKIMGFTAYTLEQKEKEFENVAQAYLRCNLNEGDAELFMALISEFERRSMYEIFALEKDGVENDSPTR